jgi:transposase-like protein
MAGGARGGGRITDHVGCERHQEPPGGSGNTGNGSTPKRLITEHGEVPIDTPRDRDGTRRHLLTKDRQEAPAAL